MLHKVGTVPDMPNIHIQFSDNYWTSFWSPMGLDESSGRNPTTFLHGIAFRVYLVFCKHMHNHQTLLKMNVLPQR